MISEIGPLEKVQFLRWEGGLVSFSDLWFSWAKTYTLCILRCIWAVIANIGTVGQESTTAEQLGQLQLGHFFYFPLCCLSSLRTIQVWRLLHFQILLILGRLSMNPFVRYVHHTGYIECMRSETYVLIHLRHLTLNGLHQTHLHQYRYQWRWQHSAAN